jgi:hypothetical protein
MSDTCKVFDNLHMQCMCIWMHPYNITAALIDQTLGSHRAIWVTPGREIMVKCSDWGCRPNQDWSHINVRHMQGVWKSSYAVDVNMDASLQHYGRSHWPIFGKSPSNLFSPGGQMMVKSSDWGCRPNQDWSHINVRHMQSIWQSLYAVDVHMDASLQHYGRSHWPIFGKSPRNLGNSW